MTKQELERLERNLSRVDKLQKDFNKLMVLWYKIKNKKGIKFKIYRTIMRWVITINLRLRKSYIIENKKSLSKISKSS